MANLSNNFGKIVKNLPVTNENSLAFDNSKTKSFADRLKDLQNTDILEKDIVTKDGKHANKHGQEILGNKAKKTTQQKEFLGLNKQQGLEHQATIKDQQLKSMAENSLQETEKFMNELKASETELAAAGQAHQKKQTEEAINDQAAVQQQQQQQEQSNSDDGREYLSRWEDLTPQVTEDPKNRAIRIDIPGVISLIAIRGNSDSDVELQVMFESKSDKALLESNKGELMKRLAKKNVRLSDFQTFYAKDVEQANKEQAEREASA